MILELHTNCPLAFVLAGTHLSTIAHVTEQYIKVDSSLEQAIVTICKTPVGPSASAPVGTCVSRGECAIPTHMCTERIQHARCQT